MVEIMVVGVAALLTSILSAVAGLGGGVILLLVIAQFVAPTAAIPIQGAIQLVSNGSRAVLLRREVSWQVVRWASILLFPASLLGVKVATSMPGGAVRLVLAIFVLVVAWRPHLLGIGGARSATPSESRKLLVGVGAVSGLLNTTVGVSGPMTSPFFKAVTTTHVAFVATAATTQLLAHMSKLVAFTGAGWSIQEHGAMIAAGIVGVVIGSWVGTKLLTRTPKVALDRVFKVVLTMLAARMLYSALSSGVDIEPQNF